MTIPNVAVYKRLPFSQKCLEVWTVKDEFKILTKAECDRIEPYMLMISSDGWAEIKKAWLKGCLVAGKKCEQHVKATSDFIQYLDKLFLETFRESLVKRE